VTCDVTKLERSKLVRYLQPWNIRDISITFETLNEDKSTEVNDRQFENIESIYNTEDVWKLPIYKFVK
jgi:hypothetical protein